MKIKASYHQERLWFLHQLESEDRCESGPVYHNIPLILEINSRLDIHLLEQSLGTVVNRHEALRTRMIVVEDRLFQQVEPKVEFKLQVKDLSSDGDGETHESLLEMAIEESKRPFLLEGGLLVRALLLKAPGVKSVLVITLHHLVSDRYSLGTIAAEFVRCCRALGEGLSPDLPDLPLHYADFSQWQRELPEDFLESNLFYWRRRLSHLSPLELPTGTSTRRTAVYAFREARAPFRLSAALSTGIREFCRQKGTGNDLLLLAAFKTLLHRYCSQEDIVVGTSADNRHQPGTENIVGPVANLLVLRSKISGTTSFSSYLYDLAQTLEQAYENQDIPFERLAMELFSQKDIGRTDFFDVFWQYREKPFQLTPVKNLEIKYVETNLGWGKYDLNLFIWGEDSAFSGVLVYNKDYYEDTFIRRFIGHYKVLLESILQEPDRPVSRLDVLPPGERRQLLVEWNQTRALYPEEKTIHQLFAEQTAKTPGAAAVVYQDRTLSYRWLDTLVSRLAVYLKENSSIHPGDLIGITVERSEKMIAGLLGILTAGGAYVPIDVNYPEERKQYILKDSNASLLLTDRDLEKILREPGNPSHLHTCSPAYLPAAAPAYVIYTSGTTGRPKGCIVTHRNLVRLFKNDRMPFHFNERDTWVMAHSFCFDFSVWEMYGALLYGGRVIIPPLDHVRDVNLFLSFIKKHKVTVLNQTPQAFYALVETETRSGEHTLNRHLHCVIFGGDKLLPHNLSRWVDIYSLEEIHLVNMYGITETTVHVTYCRLKESDIRAARGKSPIGWPLPETTLYILDDFLDPVPVGITGELFVGGTGVARGYLNRVKLTPQRFIENPHVPGEIIYKSGDLGRRLPDGNVEYLCRNDDQVQVRGYRIEPAEVQNHILEHPAVKEAVVTAGEDKDHQTFLCAYIRLAPGESVPDIREHLSGTLPPYMIPAYVVPVNAIPLTSNGKVDRKALPDPWTAEEKQNRIPPRNPVEETLTEIWAEVLGIKKEGIGINDDFFELGGHSLKATALIAKVHQQLDVKLPLVELFEAPKLRDLAEYIAGLTQDKYAAIEPVETKEYYLLSPAQKRMYIIMEMVPGSTGYNMPQTVPLDSLKEGDVERLEQTVKKLVNRHESLRTSFEVIDGEPVQRIHETVDSPVSFYRAADAVEARAVLEDFIKPFDLACAPLWRIGVLQVGAGQHLFLLDMHHIISDGVSNEVMIRDFTELYEDRHLPELRIQYKDFAQWLHCPEVKEAIRQQENYWLMEFEEEIPLLDLPIDYPRPVVQSFEGSCLDFEVSPRHTRALEAAAAEEGATLFMVLLAVINVLLAKLSGQEDIIVGSPVAGRRHADLEKIIGMFINTLAMRNYPKGEKTFYQFLKEIKENTLKAFDNQEYPFEVLVEKVDVKRDASRNPLFDVMFALQTFFGQDLPAPDQNQFQFEDNIAKFDFTVAAAKAAGEKLWVSFQYCTKLFKKETVERFITYFKKIVSSLVEEPGTKLGQIEIISEQEKRKILHDFNDTGEEFPLETTLHRLFEAQAAKRPDTISLACDREGNRKMVTLTYRELNERADRLAHLLIEKGVKENHLVGLLAHRSIEMIVGMLGILKAGGAYIPLNPKAPASRNEFILEECSTGILVSGLSGVSKVSEGIDLIEIIGPIGPIGPIKNGCEELSTYLGLAYVIFTSGSTGNPKGVSITHGNLSPLLHWGYRELGLGPGDRVIQNLSYYFDWSVWEIFITLTSGAGLTIVSEEVLLHPELCAAFIDKQNITALHVTPSQYQYLAQTGYPLETLKYLFIGAEKLTLELVRRSFQLVKAGCRVFNMYGPTECTIITSVLEIEAGALDAYEYLSSVPIGPPVANVDYLVLDQYLRLCPPLVTGELYICGDGVSRGYLNNPELTAASFNRSYRSYRSYKTGDLCRWLPDGTVEYLGRIDHQVKVRGYRIELGEIENQLLKHQQVRDAVVLVNEEAGGDKYLCAYLVPEEMFSVAELKQYLAQHLPDYMVPSYFVQIDKIPLNPNGKLDRRALPPPRPAVEEEYKAPGNDVEMKLVEIWADVLGIQADIIGIDANFFQLGGHSLSAAVLLAKIHRELDVKIPLVEIFTNPTVQELADCIQGLTAGQYTAIEPVEKKDYYPASSNQQRLYVLQQMEPGSTVYNMPLAIPLEGEVDVEKLAEIFIQLIERHESFRTSFEMVNEGPVQRVHENVGFEIAHLSGREIEQTVREFVKPFDLSHAPLLRVGVTKSAGDKNFLVVDMHHIISDGFSFDILTRDFTALYMEQDLAPLGIQYKDFAEWRNSEAEKEVVKQQETFWLGHFQGEIPLLNLPMDFPRPVVQSFEGGMVEFEISAADTAALKTAALTNNSTLYMVLLTIFNILLAKLGSQEDIIVGTTVAGRRHADLEKIIGMFVNTMALRNYPGGEKPFKAFLREVKDRTLQAFENQEYPFEDLVEKVEVNRDTSRNPLFDVMFSMQNIFEEQEDIEDQNQFEDQTAKFDLTLGGAESRGRLLLGFQYCIRLFKRETIERFSTYFKNILSAFLETPGMKLGQIEIISAEEKREILSDFNNTDAEFPGDKTIHQLFEEQAGKTPDGIAVIGSEHRAGSPGDDAAPGFLSCALTYTQLNKKANQLARVLKKQGIVPDSIVGLLVEPGVRMMIGMMAILKAGGAYLPIDPGLPAGRVEYIVNDAAVPVLLCHPGAAAETAFKGKRINLSQQGLFEGSSFNPANGCRPGNLAYVIYTSGSTGRPKGAAVEHSQLVNFLYHMYNRYDREVDFFDRCLSLTNIMFDVSVWEFFLPLAFGAQLILLPGQRRFDVFALVEAIVREGITLIYIPPALLKEVSEQLGKQRSRLRLNKMLVGVEPIHDEVLEAYMRLNPQMRIINGYGPTETTICASSYNYTSHPPQGEIVPIGAPLSNNRIVLLDNAGHVVPQGIAGEICISGAGVSRGYLNNPELTAEKFNRSYRSYRSYKTGDLARWLPDGNIRFLGRMDHQVKVRGHRIELGEIESWLLKHQNVREAVVLVRGEETGDKYICAYLVHGEEFSIDELKQYLSVHLPEYMIPSYFMEIDKIPLTPNGKIDRKALPLPQVKIQGQYKAPRNQIEIKLADMWSEILGVRKDIISIDADFFQLGGHSLKATALVSKMQRAFNVTVPLIEVFTKPSIEALAVYIREGEKAGPETGIPAAAHEHLVLLKPGPDDGQHLFLVHDGSGEVEGYMDFCKGLTHPVNCWGLRADRPGNLAPLNCTIEEMARTYIKRIREVQPHGPYWLVGWSLGGTVAFEMALQLEKMGIEVDFLGLIDSPGPGAVPGQGSRQFTLESELDWVWEYLPGNEIKEKLRKAADINEIWPIIVNHLEENNVSVEWVKSLIPHDLARIIPHYDQLGIRELISYLNIGRTLSSARAGYVPFKKINTALHYFKASQSPGIGRDCWSDYCSKPMKSYDIPGDHFSIFKKDNVEQITHLFDMTLLKNYNDKEGCY